MRKIDLKNVVWKEGRYYVAQCLNVDISSFGITKEKALAALDEALELYFEDQSKVELTPINKPQLQDLSIQVHA